MSTITVLEGCDVGRWGKHVRRTMRQGYRRRRNARKQFRDCLGNVYEYDAELGWSLKKAWRKTKRIARKVTRKVTRPVARVMRPVTRPVSRVARKLTRPVDRVLKRTPIVRSVYRKAIATTYVATGQWGKVPGAYKRTWKALKQDSRVVYNGVKALAIAIVRPFAKKGLSRTTAKGLLIPKVTAAATAKFGPPGGAVAVPATNEAINIVWRSIKRKILPKTGKLVAPAPAYEAQKQPFIPKPTGSRGPAYNPYAPQPEQYEEVPEETGGGAGAGFAVAEIGRASCRGRV